MEQIKNINLEIDELEKISDLKYKTELIKKTKDKIKEEQEHIDSMIEKVNQNKSKKYKKFKGISIDNLVTMFHQEENFKQKIEIFQQLNYLIDSIKNQLFEV